MPPHNLPRKREEGEAHLKKDSAARLIAFDEIRPESVRWLWPGRIPLAKITILQGDPGLGKSTLAIELAARLTCNAEMPDRTRSDLDAAVGAVVLTAEDGLADTVRPRLDAAGADTARVKTFAPDEHIRIPRDVGRIADAIQEAQAKLVILDPLAAFLDAGINSWQNQSVRLALAPLAKTAEHTGAAILVLDHLTKAQGRAAVHRGNGSIAFNAAARSVLMAGKHPDEQGCCVLASVKSNNSRMAASLMYQVEQAENGAVRLKWLGECPFTADDLGGAMPTEHVSKVQECAEWLREKLATGAAILETVLESEAAQMGFSKRTFQRARRAAGVKSQRISANGAWALSLAVANLN